MLKSILLSTLAAGLIIAAPAVAKDYPNGGVTGNEVISDLNGIDHTGKLDKDSAGDPLVRAAFKVGDTEIDYQIYFYGCESGRCKSIQYHVAFDGDASKLAEWNKGNRFGRAYAGSDNTIHVEYDIDVEKGANSVAIQNTAQRFVAVMVQAVKVLG